ncbi:hypothetical protein M0Q97_07695 [Candidatus Dojkabacteria bacterium]|jgi:hypothetical protein|nr:hypothetical protein [Candidatus Dojkabacteria bacterium]
MTDLEKKYNIDVRANIVVLEHGSIENAISNLKIELEEYEKLWNKYSCDCLGHGIICNRLLINWLNNKLFIELNSHYLIC